MIMGVVGMGFYFGGVARTLDLMVPEAISKNLEPMLPGPVANDIHNMYWGQPGHAHMY